MDHVMLITGLGCGVFLCWSTGSLVRLWKQLRTDRQAARSVRRRRQRRLLAAAIIAVVSIAFFLGVNFVDHQRSPQSFAALWIVVLLMLLWLIGLALADVWQSLRERQAAMNKLRQELLTHLPGQDPNLKG